jgi:hypothetical protein
MELTLRQELNLLKAQLDSEFSSFKPHYQDLGDYFLPRRAEFQVTDTNRGDRRNQKIFDTTPLFSVRTLQSGLMSGITSPARPWFTLTVSKKELKEFGPVKRWLSDVTDLMRSVFLRSNLYNALPIAFGDLGVFGVSCILMAEDFEEVVRFYPQPIGSYRLANSARLGVDTYYREFRKTVRQLVEEYADRKNGKIVWDNFSEHVRRLYENKHFETWIDVGHVIRPNRNFDPSKLNSKFKRFESITFETGGSGLASNYLSGEKETFLRQSGFDFFTPLCPRWQTNGESVYGTDCPGMIALPDNKQLQLGEKKVLKAIDKSIDPPMKGPTHLRQVKHSILPGDMTYTDERGDQGGYRPVHEINFRFAEIENKQAQVRNRIQRAFFEDLFLMLAASDRRNITAREVEERHEEKLLALGPVLEQLNQDLLDPLISNTFQIMLRQGIVPTPPEELQGVPLKIEYISIMAQAQKLVGISSMERFMTYVTTTAANTQNPSLLDKVDTDQFIDEYGDSLGVPPKMIRSDDEVEAIRAQREEAMRQQRAQEAIPAMAGAAKSLAGADMEGDNALTRLIDEANSGSLVQGA